MASTLRMPHVFVIPPEEEQQETPPWCCFDADELPENNGNFPSAPDIHFLDVPYLLQQTESPTPVFRRPSIDEPGPPIVMPKKGGRETRSRTDSTSSLEREIEEFAERSRRRDAREDSDVIEVVKVKRSKEPVGSYEEIEPKMKRSKTFKARATKAFKSIKNLNVGKGPQRKPHVKELWTSSESMPGIFKGVQEQIRQQQEQFAPPLPQPSLSRRNSRSLSHLFQTAKAPRFERTPQPSPPVSPSEPSHIIPSATSSSLPYLRGSDTTASLVEVSAPSDYEGSPERPVSPGLSVRKSRRRFSVLELHRLFSFSSSSPDDPAPPSPSSPTTVFAPSRNDSAPSSSTSTSSSDCPDVPIEEGAYAAVRFLDLDLHDINDKGLGKPIPSHWSQSINTEHASTLPPSRDLSFEMRLDSLHFDSLSFDPEDFDVSITGIAVRR
ncbi:hypothetical protein BJ138DRAFT_1140412 [Hygrophoropsis aurantiaca]|uniref:Uncharacterized protein n=1 Tax=Hygrophoropsis aurantiaca TaxID=72124 RepID=A0ACB8ARX1_9AGAM|nr:hypothetical protein BJ138DRAFT_1140412 [Hygrophoropsis aurantiaca]